MDESKAMLKHLLAGRKQWEPLRCCRAISACPGQHPLCSSAFRQVLLPFEDQMAWAAALGALQREQRYSEGALERAVEVMRADVSPALTPG